jgi:CRP/FNR family transcriptional regulator, cyclic AMP receptor protein
VGRPQSLIDRLAPEDRVRVRSIGTERQLNRSDILLSQGEYQDGVALVESGLIRSFYTAPSGRQITLACWHLETSLAVRTFLVGLACGLR